MRTRGRARTSEGEGASRAPSPPQRPRRRRAPSASAAEVEEDAASSLHGRLQRAIACLDDDGDEEDGLARACDAAAAALAGDSVESTCLTASEGQLAEIVSAVGRLARRSPEGAFGPATWRAAFALACRALDGLERIVRDAPSPLRPHPIELAADRYAVVRQMRARGLVAESAHQSWAVVASVVALGDGALKGTPAARRAAAASAVVGSLLNAFAWTFAPEGPKRLQPEETAMAAALGPSLGAWAASLPGPGASLRALFLKALQSLVSATADRDASPPDDPPAPLRWAGLLGGAASLSPTHEQRVAVFAWAARAAGKGPGAAMLEGCVRAACALVAPGEGRKGIPHWEAACLCLTALRGAPAMAMGPHAMSSPTAVASAMQAGAKGTPLASLVACLASPFLPPPSFSPPGDVAKDQSPFTSLPFVVEAIYEGADASGAVVVEAAAHWLEALRAAIGPTHADARTQKEEDHRKGKGKGKGVGVEMSTEMWAGTLAGAGHLLAQAVACGLGGAAMQVRIFWRGRRPPPNECRYMKEREGPPPIMWRGPPRGKKVEQRKRQGES